MVQGNRTKIFVATLLVMVIALSLISCDGLQGRDAKSVDITVLYLVAPDFDEWSQYDTVDAFHDTIERIQYPETYRFLEVHSAEEISDLLSNEYVTSIIIHHSAKKLVSDELLQQWRKEERHIGSIGINGRAFFKSLDREEQYLRKWPDGVDQIEDDPNLFHFSMVQSSLGNDRLTSGNFLEPDGEDLFILTIRFHYLSQNIID